MMKGWICRDEWERGECFPCCGFAPFVFAPFFSPVGPSCCGLPVFWKPWIFLRLKVSLSCLTHYFVWVKMIFWIFPIFLCPILEAQTILLSIGELKEIPAPNLSHYSVGNDNAISHKHLTKKNVLLFKGVKLGFSEVIIWIKGKRKKKYRFYVIDRRRQIKILHLVEAFNSAGLKVRLSGSLVVVEGEIRNGSAFRLVKKLIAKNPDDIHMTATLTKTYHRWLLGKIYRHLYDEYVENFDCQVEGITILCRHPLGAGPSSKLKKFLESRYFLTFVPIKKGEIKNYRLKMKLVQMEKLDGRELNWGLDRLEGGLVDLFDEGVSGILKKNKILLNRYKIDFSTLAEPQIVLRVGHPAHLRVGTEIPYKNIKKEIQWKFAGLEVKVELKEGKRGFYIFYSTKLSAAAEGSDNINGNDEKSSALVQVGIPLKLFEIIFRTFGKRESALPGLASVPLFGNIFRSKSDNSNFKNITAVILLEEVNDRTPYKGFF